MPVVTNWLRRRRSRVEEPQEGAENGFEKRLVDRDTFSWTILIAVIVSAILTIAVAIFECTSPIPASEAIDGSDVCFTSECQALAKRIKSDMGRADPCTNFYDYACGGYVERFQNGESSGLFLSPELTLTKRVHDQIFKALAVRNDDFTMPNLTKKVRTFYNSCAASKRQMIYTNGLETLRKIVKELGGYWKRGSTVPYYWPDHLPKWSLTDLIEKLHSKFTMNALFMSLVVNDPRNNTQNAIHLTQPVFTDYSDLNALPASKEDWHPPKSIVQHHLWLINITSPEQANSLDYEDVRRFIELGVKMSKFRQTDIEDESALRIVNLAWLKENFNIVDWNSYFAAVLSAAQLTNANVVTNSTTIVINGVEYFAKLKDLIMNSLSVIDDAEFNRNLHNFLVFQAVKKYQSKLISKNMVISAGFMESKTRPEDRLTGDSDGIPTDCVADTVSLLPAVAGAIYLNHNFVDFNEVRKQAGDIVVNVIESYREAITLSKWMDSETKMAALEKLDELHSSVAFEFWMRNESVLLTKFLKCDFTDDYANNLLALYQNDFVILNFQALTKSTEDSRLAPSVASVNAHYLHNQNKLYIPAAILTDPFFQPSLDVPDALNYGSLGAIVGHEITHAFDNVGRMYDKFGNRNTWWSDSSSLKEYRRRLSCFNDSSFLHPISASNVVNENMADAVGLQIGYRAFQKSRRKAARKRLVGLNADESKLFFIGYAQWMCTAFGNIETKELFNQHDDHSPSELRIIISLLNSDDFSKAFNCPINNHKCTLW